MLILAEGGKTGKPRGMVENILIFNVQFKSSLRAIRCARLDHTVHARHDMRLYIHCDISL